MSCWERRKRRRGDWRGVLKIGHFQPAAPGANTLLRAVAPTAEHGCRPRAGHLDGRDLAEPPCRSYSRSKRRGMSTSGAGYGGPPSSSFSQRVPSRQDAAVDALRRLAKALNHEEPSAAVSFAPGRSTAAAAPADHLSSPTPPTQRPTPPPPTTHHPRRRRQTLKHNMRILGSAIGASVPDEQKTLAAIHGRLLRRVGECHRRRRVTVTRAVTRRRIWVDQYQ